MAVTFFLLLQEILNCSLEEWKARSETTTQHGGTERRHERCIWMLFVLPWTVDCTLSSSEPTPLGVCWSERVSCTVLSYCGSYTTMLDCSYLFSSVPLLWSDVHIWRHCSDQWCSTGGFSWSPDHSFGVFVSSQTWMHFHWVWSQHSLILTSSRSRLAKLV